jgi:hypothetical protein
MDGSFSVIEFRTGRWRGALDYHRWTRNTDF